MNEYQTTDFYLTAFLLADGCQLKLADQDPFGKLTFNIVSNKSMESSIKSFYAGIALVNPLEYQNQLRNLKSLIYAIKKGGSPVRVNA